MVWVALQHTKKAIGRAGDTLINPLSTEEEYSQALSVLNNWRASHAFPLNSLQTSLRYRAVKITDEALITQRLKRVPSILRKLHRFPDMKLNRMQDIGGCRAVVPTLVEVHQLRELMINDRLKSELAREYDYINSPKDSGYRGIHLVYKYQSKNQELYNGHLIEIQIRSLIQHAWATSVEIAETFLGDSLKSGQGSPEWLRLFKLISILFAEYEGCLLKEIDTNQIRSIKQESTELASKLSIFEKLRAFSVVTNSTEHGNEYDKSGYFLLVLDINKKTVLVENYSKEDQEDVNNKYLALEKEYENTNVNVVLVAAESILSLKRAYPNYFADSEYFLETLNNVLF